MNNLESHLVEVQRCLISIIIDSRHLHGQLVAQPLPRKSPNQCNSSLGCSSQQIDEYQLAVNVDHTDGRVDNYRSVYFLYPYWEVVHQGSVKANP